LITDDYSRLTHVLLMTVLL